MRAKIWVWALAALVFASAHMIASAQQSAVVQHVKFGILRLMANGEYELDRETARIPRRYKSSGFRFGVAFDNPSGARIEWYEVVHLPAKPRQLSGDLRQVKPTVLQTDTLTGNDRRIVDNFWFDDGDPLGPHRFELYVNGVKQWETAFEVVEPR